ncbi:hypothetical protein RSAG8_13679, partial [Rhizoctonia solani AG-8 WAC10335]
MFVSVCTTCHGASKGPGHGTASVGGGATVDTSPLHRQYLDHSLSDLRERYPSLHPSTRDRGFVCRLALGALIHLCSTYILSLMYDVIRRGATAANR